MAKRLPLLFAAFVLILTLFLIGYTVVSYPFSLVAEIGISTLLLAALALGGRIQRMRLNGESIVPRASSDLPLVVFLVVVSSAITIQTLTARESYGSIQALNAARDYPLIVRLVHYALTSVIVWGGDQKAQQSGMAVALVYTSSLYTPSFAVPEAGLPFGVLFVLALVLWIRVCPVRPVASSAFGPLLAFAAWCIGASILSLYPAASLVFFLKLLTLLLLIWVLALTVTVRQWQRILVLTALVAVAVPTLLGVAKLVELAWSLGLRSAAGYRLGITELGGANLIARTLVVGFPVVLALSLTSRHKIAWRILAALSLVAFVASRSWGGWTGAAATFIIILAVVRGEELVRKVLGRRLVAYGLPVLAIISVLVLAWLATRSNITSFNGRLIHFRIALEQSVRHPLFGVGPGHHFANARYADSAGWIAENWFSLDNPLWVISMLPRLSVMHSHNLFLELTAGMGILGLVLFAWFVVSLLRRSVGLLPALSGEQRYLLLACITGIVASLGWGLLDVMEISPPFFTSPTWALVGLLFAAPRVFKGDERRVAEKGPTARAKALPFSLCSDSWGLPRVAGFSLLSGLAFTTVIVLMFGNLHFRRAFVAYEERRWATAADQLARAARWEPVNAKLQQLRAEALINLGRYAEATSSYERAVHLQRDFAPFHTQLGWLYWLQGDLKQATTHFRNAVDMDPREALQRGSHADLGLAYVAQGRIDEAVPLFKETIERHPQMARAPYWVPVQGAGGGFNVVLDPTYAQSGSGVGEPLQVRILAHLGRADHTPRLHSPDIGRASPLSFNQVLDAIEADYLAVSEEGAREAPRLLAALAEAARLVGLYGRAERAYSAFQEAHPQSAYGFRDLGGLYHEQQHLGEAQKVLERAVAVSPRDYESWYQLAEVHLDRGQWHEAEEVIGTVYRLAPSDAGPYSLRALLHQAFGNVAEAADALEKSLSIEESVPDRLRLAELYHQMGRFQQASNQCIKAAQALLGTWPRPLDPELWEIGACLARTGGADLPAEITTIAYERPLIANTLLGHVHRAQGELVQALAAYRRAASTRPHEGGPHYFLAETYQALGELQSAEAEYRLAAELDPLESLSLLALGRLQWSQGLGATALETYREAVEATPGWGRVHVAMGNALLALGDRDSAAQYYQQAQIADADLSESLVYDFVAHLAEADVPGESLNLDYVRNDYFTIHGDERRVLFMHPDTLARYVVDVPEGAVLAFDVAMSPESWMQPGDGVDFAIYVESERGALQLFSLYIHPKQDTAARRWHSYIVDLTPYGDQTVAITFETDSGPADDERYDWAGWGAPRLLVPRVAGSARYR